MLNRRIATHALTALAALALSTTVVAQQQAGTSAKAPASPVARATPAAAPRPAAVTPSPAMTAIDEAAKADKFIFVFFYREQDEPTVAMRSMFDAAMEKLADRATATVVNVADPQQQPLVDKYQVNRSPMPLVLAMAPNGAVTRSFPRQVTQAMMETAFVSPGMQKSLKALQDRKMAFLCFQNGTTQHNAEAMQGVREFAADPQFAKTTEIITVDPADTAEASLLMQFRVDPRSPEAVTVFLAPPGKIVGTYTGEIKKDVLVAAAKTAAKGCDPKSGCCAPKKPANAPPQPQGRPQPHRPGSTAQKP
jgi:hypothetical protein